MMLGFETIFWALVTAMAAFGTWHLIAELWSVEKDMREKREMLRRIHERYERDRLAEERLEARRSNPSI